MTSMSEIFRSDVADRLGWVLLHSLWQIALVAAVLGLLLGVLRRRSPNLRYVTACAGLAAMFVLPVATWGILPDRPAPEPTALSAPPDNPRPVPVDTVLPNAELPSAELPSAARSEVAPSTPSPANASAVPPPQPSRSLQAATPLPKQISRALSPWVPWLVMAWFIGVFSLSVWHLGGWIAMQRLKHLGTLPGAEQWTQRMTDLAQRMKLGRRVQMLRSALVDVPAVIGWLRPVVLVPAAMLGQMSPQQIDAVLAHELAHVRRWDYLVNLLQTFVETLLFFHPAVWWLSRRIRIEREHCCDDLAVSVCGARVEYAEALASLEHNRSLPRAAVAARSPSGGTALRRVRRILGVADPHTRSWGAALGGVAATMLLVAVVAGYAAWADESEADPVEEPTAHQPELTKTYDVAGMKIEAGFLPDETEIILGQPSFVTFTVTSRGDRPYRFAVGGDNRGSVRHNNFRITAVDAKGRPVKDPHSYNNFGGRPWEVTLKPGESHTERLYLGHWLTLDRTGTCTVTCRRTLQDDLGPPPRHPEAPIATQFELKVMPYDRAEMQQVIARFGKDVRKGDEQKLRDATLALADIDDQGAIPHLAASLRRGDYQNRIPAVKGLARFSTDAAGDALREALKDPDHAVREAAGRALRETKQVGRVVKTLLDQLRDQSPDVRRGAATALGQTGSAAALDPLIEALDDSDSSVRKAAALALGELGEQRATEPLHRRLRHSDRVLRVAAADALRRLTGNLDPKWLTPVIRETTDINDRTFHESIRLIRVYTGTAAAPALIGCLRFDDPSPKGHHNFFLILSIHHAKNGPDCYYRWKHDPNIEGTPEQIENNTKILDELKQWAAERSAETVRRAVQIADGMRGVSMQARRPRSDGKPDPIEDRRRKILDELRALGKDAVPALCDALRDQNVMMRRNAALVLIELRGEWTGHPVVDTRAAVPGLINATEDTDTDVRAWAAHALAEMGPDAAPAVDALIKLLEDPEEGPRNTSAMALGKIGPAAAKAAPALTKALQDESEDVRTIAAAALEKIRNLDSSARDPASEDKPKHHFALFRVLGHRDALPFGGKEMAERRKILFSGVSDEGDGSRRFDSMRPEYYPIERLILDKTPLLTDADIVGYDWPKHEIHLKPGVRQRLLRGIKPSVWGVPFAVVADGEPLYLGAFWTGASSYMANMPTISVDPWQWALPKTEPNYLPENAIRIENNQALKPGEKLRDPRANPRLRQALDRAEKLIDRRPGAGLEPDQPAESEIPAESATGGEKTPWGKPIEGVQCRLRPEKLVWTAGDDPTFKVDIRNKGVRELKTSLIASLAVEVDGTAFAPRTWFRLGTIGVMPFGPRAQHTIDVSLGDFGSRQKGAENLSPGKHTVRVVLLNNRVGENGIHTSLDKYKETALAHSNPVEIEIVAGNIQWGPATDGLQAGLAFDPQDRPYRMGEVVGFRLYVRNAGDEAVELVDFGTMGWMPTARDSAGKTLMIAGVFDGPVQRRRRALAAGGTMPVGNVELKLDEDAETPSRQPPHAHLLPGTYRVSQTYRFADDPEATWSGELTSGELELKVVAAEPPAEREPGITDLDAFRRQRALGNRAKDFDTKLRHFRDALTWESDHPEKVALEYQVAVMFKEHTAGHDRMGADWPRNSPWRKEALVRFRAIVDRYDHMAYYTNMGANGPWEAEVVVPQAAVRSAVLLAEQGGDQKEVAQYWSRALEMMNQTCRRRIQQWANAPEPRLQPLGGAIEEAKHEGQVAEWNRRKAAAAKGEVLTVSELRVVDGMVPSIDPNRGGRATPEVLARLRQIGETYRGTAIARIARQRLEAAKGDPGVLLRQLNAGELSHEKIRQITGKVLAIQGDLEQPWDGAWGNWLETARPKGKVSDADFTRYARQSNPTWKLLALQVTSEEGKVGLSFGISHFGGRVASATTDHNLIIKHRLVRLRLGELPLDVGNTGGEWSFAANTQHGFGLFREKSKIDALKMLKPGKYQAVAELEVTIYEAGKPETTLHRLRTEIKDEVKLTELLLGSADPPGGSDPPAEDGHDEAWGPAIEGVQCRLEPDKPTWKDDEIPRLKAYVRHQTETRVFLSNHPSFGARLEVDGHWHRWSGPMRQWQGQAHGSSKFRTKDAQPLEITLDENWKQVENKQLLRLDLGKHVVRFAWEGYPERAPREGPDDQRNIVLVSNPVEITVWAARPQPKPSDVHPADKDAVTALRQLGAILTAGDQGRIRSVRLSRTAVTNADLGHLKGLSGLRSLYLDDTRISDAGLGHVAGLTGLETLSLNYTRVGDGGLEHLKGLAKLTFLELLDTEVTAAGLRELKKTLPRLQTTVDPLKLSGLGELRGWRNSAELNDNYELVGIDLLGPEVQDAWLERLKDRHTLQDVCLDRRKITDAGLAHLQGLTDLHTLYLSGTRVTDRGLEYLKGMKNLRTLFLAGTPIADAGLAHLSGLTNLELLWINGTRVSDAGLVHLEPLTKLTRLKLNDCQVSGVGLSHLRGLTRLTSLELNGTAVADAGLVHLKPLENLELLYLSNTSVTDYGLQNLGGLKKLRMLEIEHAHVTDEGIERLKQELPETSFYP